MRSRSAEATPSVTTASGSVEDRWQKRARRALGGIVVVALVLRIALSLGVLQVPDRSLTPDGLEYQAFGQSIAAGRGFVRIQPLADGQPVAFPEVFRTPGYPLFLALTERIWPGGATRLAILLQILIGSVTCVLVYAITHHLTNRALPALGAALFVAIEASAAVHSALLLSETLAVFFLASALLFGLRFVRNRGFVDLFLASSAFVLAAHARPVFLSAGLPLSVALFVGWRTDPKRFAAGLLIVLLTVGAGIGGWVIRNAVTSGYGVFSAVNDFSLLFHGAGLEAREVGGEANAIVESYIRELNRDLPANTKQLDQARWYSAMRAKAWREIRSRLRLVPAYAARNLAQLLTSVDHEDFRQVAGYPPAPAGSGGGPGSRLKRSMTGMPGLWLVVGAQLVMTGMLWVGVLCAAARTIGNRIVQRIELRREVACLLVAAALGLAAGALPNAQARFRLSFLPLFVPLAALGYFGTARDAEKQ